MSKKRELQTVTAEQLVHVVGGSDSTQPLPWSIVGVGTSPQPWTIVGIEPQPVPLKRKQS